MGIAERKQREREARIKSIKKSAMYFFSKKGFENTTMSEIADRAEISKGTVYLFFRSKEELLYTIMEPYLEEYINELIEVTDNEKEKADNTLKRFADFVCNKYEADPDLFNLMIDYRAEKIQPLYTKERAERLQELMRKNGQAVENIIAKGIKQEIFKPVNARVITILIWSSFIGITIYEKNRAFAGRKSYMKPMLREAIQLVLEGLRV